MRITKMRRPIWVFVRRTCRKVHFWRFGPYNVYNNRKVAYDLDKNIMEHEKYQLKYMKYVSSIVVQEKQIGEKCHRFYP